MLELHCRLQGPKPYRRVEDHILFHLQQSLSRLVCVLRGGVTDTEALARSQLSVHEYKGLRFSHRLFRDGHPSRSTCPRPGIFLFFTEFAGVVSLKNGRMGGVWRRPMQAGACRCRAAAAVSEPRDGCHHVVITHTHLFSCVRAEGRFVSSSSADGLLASARAKT